MNIFWILVIVAAALIIFSGIFGFRGAVPSLLKEILTG
jgi:hypothetical protein